MRRLVIHRECLHAGPPVEAAITAVAARPEAAILDSADTGPGRGRYTILACDPLEVLTTWTGDPDPLETLRNRLAGLGVPGAPVAATEREGDRFPSHLSFVGGWIGYLAYEAGHYIERIPGRPRADIRLPVARWALYDAAAIHDALTDSWTIVAVDLRGHHPGAPAPTARIAFWTDCLGNARPLHEPACPETAASVVENMTHVDYLASVRRAKEYIAAGDIFQVNLARRMSIRQRVPAIDTYLRLRRQNPAAYAAYLAWDHARSAILSASPELFLELRDGVVTTRPIKGTRPRSDDPVLDVSYRAELLNSEKDRAELAMIVDLERNDLGRVCEYGTIRVRPPLPLGRSEDVAHFAPHASLITHHAFAQLESHPTVHHLVATVTGRLRADCGPIELLRATFPGGSITGAPKVRAMEIIDELEPTQRGVYTGAIGCLGLDGAMMLNIAIRTILIADGRAHIHVGSGIVADSDPHEEYAETVAKAAGLCDALGLGRHAEGRSRLPGRT